MEAKNRLKSALISWVFAASLGLGLPSQAMSASPNGLYGIPLTNIDGKKTNLEAYKNKVLLIVNTASKCGYTPQYAALQKLHEKYRDRGFAVLGFPSNDFGGQEPGSNSEIRFFCSGNYKVDFPLFEKASVTGQKTQPLYKFLLSQSRDASPVEWNFEKFLIGRDGMVVARFRSAVTPDGAQLVGSIESALDMHAPKK